MGEIKDLYWIALNLADKTSVNTIHYKTKILDYFSRIQEIELPSLTTRQ